MTSSAASPKVSVCLLLHAALGPQSAAMMAANLHTHAGSGGGGGAGKTRKDNTALNFERHVPKFLQPYAHLLGQKRQDEDEPQIVAAQQRLQEQDDDEEDDKAAEQVCECVCGLSESALPAHPTQVSVSPGLWPSLHSLIVWLVCATTGSYPASTGGEPGAGGTAGCKLPQQGAWSHPC